VPPRGGSAFFLRALCTQNGQADAGARRSFRRGRRIRRPDGHRGQPRLDHRPGPERLATVKIDGSTTVSKNAGASVADIKKGDSVMVAGANAQPGAVARSITILPATGSN
jgi:hypothetical protein